MKTTCSREDFWNLWWCVLVLKRRKDPSDPGSGMSMRWLKKQKLQIHLKKYIKWQVWQARQQPQFSSSSWARDTLVFLRRTCWRTSNGISHSWTFSFFADWRSRHLAGFCTHTRSACHGVKYLERCRYVSRLHGFVCTARDSTDAEYPIYVLQYM